MNTHLSVEIVRAQINGLILQYPELTEDDQLRADSIEGETDAYDLLRKIEAMRRDAAAMAGACATTIAELELRQGRFVRREQAMRAFAMKLMKTASIRKHEMPEATYSIRNGVSKVIITDENFIPDILCRIKREPDKTKIKKLLTNGNPVRGAELSNAEPTLTINTK